MVADFNGFTLDMVKLIGIVERLIIITIKFDKIMEFNYCIKILLHPMEMDVSQFVWIV